MNFLNYINVALLTVGLWKLFPKCGVKKFWAFVPFLRIYKLAQTADREDAGILYLLTDIVSTVTLVFLARLDIQSLSDMRTIFVSGFLLMLIFAKFIYGIRIFIGVCELFERKKLWVILWLYVACVPAIIWGFSSRTLSIETEPVMEAAPDSGIEAEATDKGLSINLNKRTARDFLRRKVLLRDIHLNIRPGRMVLLLGGSGAGKTTLINAIIGYEKANAHILLDGQDVYKEYDKMLYEIGLVPQQDLIRYDDTVVRTLTDAAVLRLPENIGRKERNQRVKEVLDIFGLGSVANSEVEKLSGGQKKRLSIATEFIADPSLFVLDEPDSGLDGVLARDLMERLRKISRQGKIVIVITHSPDRVLDLFDDVIVLGKDAKGTGRLVFYGSVEQSREFFGTDRMENVVKQINRVDEGGEGKADMLIEKYMEVCHA